MSDNRMSLRCVVCGERRFLAKRFGDMYTTVDVINGESLADRLESFLVAHRDCGAVDLAIHPDHFVLDFEHGRSWS